MSRIRWGRVFGWVIVPLIVWGAIFFAVRAFAADAPAPAPVPARVETVPAAKLRTAVTGWRRARSEVRALRRTLAASPDFNVSLQLAGIVYGQDWHHLKACALSEGGREQERFARYNTRPNASGSGAVGFFQFMPGTFAGTPFGQLPIARQDVQAFAAGWMWSRGRRGEWTGGGC